MANLSMLPALGEWPSPLDSIAIATIATGVYLASGAPLRRWPSRDSVS